MCCTITALFYSWVVPILDHTSKKQEKIQCWINDALSKLKVNFVTFLSSSNWHADVYDVTKLSGSRIWKLNTVNTKACYWHKPESGPSTPILIVNYLIICFIVILTSPRSSKWMCHQNSFFYLSCDWPIITSLTSLDWQLPSDLCTINCEVHYQVNTLE
jgi:hypothetical protein